MNTIQVNNKHLSENFDGIFTVYGIKFKGYNPE